jgi:hypothetical protein
MTTNVSASTDRVTRMVGFLGNPEILIESGHRWG